MSFAALTRLVARRRRGDEGAYAILYAILVVVLFGLAAVVVDLAALRSDRRENRAEADNTALVAGQLLESKTPDPYLGCQAAWRYLDAQWNTTVNTVSACSAYLQYHPYTGTCTEFTAPVPYTPIKTAGHTVTFVWPVPNSSTYMVNPDVKPGSVIQASDPTFDGSNACQRFGIKIDQFQNFGLAAVLGASGTTVTDASVALGFQAEQDNGPAIPLVVLDPTACQAVSLQGQGTVWVYPSADGSTAGRIAIDSAGAGCTSANPVVHVTGQSGLGTHLYALDGTSDLAEIYMYALQQGVKEPALTSNQTCPAGVHGTSVSQLSPVVCPLPVAHDQVTRTVFDNDFGCVDGTPSGFVCPHTDSTTNYIGQYVNDARSAYLNRNSPTPFGSYSKICDPPKKGASTCLAGHTCTASSFEALPVGNYVVNCPTYTIGRGNRVDFPAGSNVIFLGDVKDDGCLLFNVTAASASAADALCQSTSAAIKSTQSTVYIAGALNASTSNSYLYAPQTFMLLRNISGDPTSDSLLNLAPANVLWTAPYNNALLADVGSSVTVSDCVAGTSVTVPTASCFRKLSMWSDTVESADTSGSAYNISGSTTLGLEGSYFMPNARTYLNGSSGVAVVDAQIYTGRLTLNGGNILRLEPDPFRQEPSQTNGVRLIR